MAILPHGEPCGCGLEFVLDHNEFGLPLGYNRSCSNCGRIWYSTTECECGRSLGEEKKTRRLNTRYVDDALNSFTSCRKCFEEFWRDYDEQWYACPGGSPFSADPPPEEECGVSKTDSLL